MGFHRRHAKQRVYLNSLRIISYENTASKHLIYCPEVESQVDLLEQYFPIKYNAKTLSRNAYQVFTVIACNWEFSFVCDFCLVLRRAFSQL